MARLIGLRCRWLHALGRAGWLGWFALVARLAGWMDYWLSDWLELAELHAWLIHCVCGWLACWLDDRMSMRQGDNVDEISRITWPPLWLFRSPLWPPLWPPTLAPTLVPTLATKLALYDRPSPFKNRFPFDQICKNMRFVWEVSQ